MQVQSTIFWIIFFSTQIGGSFLFWNLHLSIIFFPHKLVDHFFFGTYTCGSYFSHTNWWIISFLELTFLDHTFSTQIGGSFLFLELTFLDFFFTQIGGSINVSSKKELIHQFMLTKMIQKIYCLRQCSSKRGCQSVRQASSSSDRNTHFGFFVSGRRMSKEWGEQSGSELAVAEW